VRGRVPMTPLDRLPLQELLQDTEVCRPSLLLALPKYVGFLRHSKYEPAAATDMSADKETSSKASSPYPADPNGLRGQPGGYLSSVVSNRWPLLISLETPSSIVRYVYSLYPEAAKAERPHRYNSALCRAERQSSIRLAHGYRPENICQKKCRSRFCPYIICEKVVALNMWNAGGGYEIVRFSSIILLELQRLLRLTISPGHHINTCTLAQMEVRAEAHAAAAAACRPQRPSRAKELNYAERRGTCTCSCRAAGAVPQPPGRNSGAAKCWIRAQLAERSMALPRRGAQRRAWCSR
jgi:hypothetical protein